MNRPAVWALLAVIAVAGLLGAELVRSSISRDAVEDALKATQEELAAQSGALVAERETQRSLRAEADGLKAQLAKLEQQLGERPRIREVVRWQTREVPVVEERRIEIPCPDGSTVTAVCPEVKLAVAGSTATAETRAGAVVVVGEAEIVRTAPLPEERFKVPFLAEASRASVAVDPPTPARWMVGPAAGLGPGGWSLGASFIGPRVRAWTVEARPSGAILVDQEGHPWGVVGLTVGLGKRK